MVPVVMMTSAVLLSLMLKWMSSVMLSRLHNPKRSNFPLLHSSVQTTIRSEERQCFAKYNFCAMVRCICVHVFSGPKFRFIWGGGSVIVGGFGQNGGGVILFCAIGCVYFFFYAGRVKKKVHIPSFFF